MAAPVSTRLARAARRPLAGAESLARLALRTERAGTPVQLYVVLNAECDLRCRMCRFWQGVYEEAGRELLSLAELTALFDEAADRGTRSLILTGGEPFLRPDLLDVVDAATPRLPFVRLQTNGLHLDAAVVERLVASGLDVLWVSLDGVGEMHDRIRGREGAFDAIVAGLERLAAAKLTAGARGPQLFVNVTVLPENRDALVPLVALAERVGAARLAFHHVSDLGREVVAATEERLGAPGAATLQFSRKSASGGRAPGGLPAELLEAIAAARARGAVAIDVDRLLLAGATTRAEAGCTWPWGVAMIGPYGDLLACQSLDGWRLGNVREAPLETHWNGRRYRAFRAQVTAGLPVCAQCCVPYRSVADHLRSSEHVARFSAGRGLRGLLFPHPA
ncbi:MAG: radical SAM protein [Deltaproteobacteria bacterium]|nr:radical SAM protein [Deltaproteobacteria bacterium]